MNTLLRFLCLTTLILFLANCDSAEPDPEPEPEPQYGSVIGQVVEIGTTTALGQTIVRIQDKAYETASDGRYQLLNIPVGVYTLEAIREGYYDFSQQVTIAEGYLTYNIELTSSIPNTRIHGIITNSLGEGLAGVAVRLDGIETQTDDSGAYLFTSVRQGIYTMDVALAGFQSFQQQVTLDQDDMEFNVELSAVLPNPPSGFQVQLIERSPGKVNTFEISWEVASGIAALKGFQLYRSMNGEPIEKVNADVIPPEATSYRDEDVASGRYTYQMTSVNIDDQEGLPARIYDPIGALQLDLVLIPAGTFNMGSNNGSSDEQPVHTVTVSQDYYIGTYEITQEEWNVVMGYNPSYFTGDQRLPVERVTWHEVQDFIEIVNSWVGDAYFRLPTEAEWEYAARAGTTTEYVFGDAENTLGDYGWFDLTSASQSQTVGGLLPNAWGVYDVHGNVSEWIQDWYSDLYYDSSPSTDPSGPESGSRRVRRGGSWQHGASYLRSASRGSNMSNYRSSNLGFRLLRTTQ